MKINNLILAHLLNTHASGVVSNDLSAISAQRWRHAVAYLYFHIGLLDFIDPENWPANSRYLSPVDFSGWSALQQKLYR